MPSSPIVNPGTTRRAATNRSASASTDGGETSKGLGGRVVTGTNHQFARMPPERETREDSDRTIAQSPKGSSSSSPPKRPSEHAIS